MSYTILEKLEQIELLRNRSLGPASFKQAQRERLKLIENAIENRKQGVRYAADMPPCPLSERHYELLKQYGSCLAMFESDNEEHRWTASDLMDHGIYLMDDINKVEIDAKDINEAGKLRNSASKLLLRAQLLDYQKPFLAFNPNNPKESGLIWSKSEPSFEDVSAWLEIPLERAKEFITTPAFLGSLCADEALNVEYDINRLRMDPTANDEDDNASYLFNMN